MSFWKPGTQPKAGKSASAVAAAVTAATAEATYSAGSSKLALSKSIMGMKFMKRKEGSAEDSDSREAKRKKLLEADKWTSETVHDQSTDMVVDSDSFCCTSVDVYADVDVLPGRRSFGGFNKPIEKQYSEAMDRLLYNVASKSVSSANDDEILEQYEQLIGLPRGPNQGKRAESSGHGRNHGHDKRNGKHTPKSEPYAKHNPNKDGVVMKKVSRK